MDDPRRSFSYSVSLDRYISPSRIIEYESSIAVSYFPLMILTLSMIMFKPTTRDGSVKKVKGGSGAGVKKMFAAWYNRQNCYTLTRPRNAGYTHKDVIKLMHVKVGTAECVISS